MRTTLFVFSLSVLTLGAFALSPAIADDFGKRFGGKAPAALSEDDAAKAVQNIEPAAGEVVEKAAPIAEKVNKRPSQNGVRIEGIRIEDFNGAMSHKKF